MWVSHEIRWLINDYECDMKFNCRFCQIYDVYNIDLTKRRFWLAGAHASSLDGHGGKVKQDWVYN